MDNNPTKIITTTNDCSEVVIQLSEVQEFDSGIDMIDIFDILNVNYTVPNYNIGDRSLTITASLLDNNFDGYFRFSTRDRKGLNTIGSVSIKGFTIDTKIIRKTDTIIFGNLRCDSLLLVNYGRFPQTISWHLAQNTAFSIPPTTLVAEIAPHDSVSIPFYTEGKQIGDIEDILQLSDLCNRSKLFSIQATCVPPLFFGESGCSLPVTLQFNPLHLLEAHNLVLRIDIPDIAQVHIMNTLGQRVLYETGITAKSISSLDVSHLSEGVYYIELRTVKGNNFGQIIMINK